MFAELDATLAASRQLSNPEEAWGQGEAAVSYVPGEARGLGGDAERSPAGRDVVGADEGQHQQQQQEDGEKRLQQQVAAGRSRGRGEGHQSAARGAAAARAAKRTGRESQAGARDVRHLSSCRQRDTGVGRVLGDSGTQQQAGHLQRQQHQQRPSQQEDGRKVRQVQQNNRGSRAAGGRHAMAALPVGGSREAAAALQANSAAAAARLTGSEALLGTSSSSRRAQTSLVPGSLLSSYSSRSAATAGAVIAETLDSAPAAASDGIHYDEQQQLLGQVEVDWEAIISRACSREETDCAICLGPLAKKEGQGLALLSCTHVFHVACVAAFEGFAASRRDVPSCPVCRGSYIRRCFEVHLEGR